jgi:hypothetical protein
LSSPRSSTSSVFPGKENHTLGRLVDIGAAASRCASPLRASSHFGGRLHCEIHSEQRPDTGLACGLGETDGPAEGVSVGQGDRVHSPLGSPLRKLLGVRGAVPQGEPGDGVQMRKSAHLDHLATDCPLSPRCHSGPSGVMTPP